MTYAADKKRLEQLAQKAGGRITPEGLITTKYTFEDAMEIEAIEARMDRYGRYHQEIFDAIRSASSVNMTQEACDKQAEEIFTALADHGFLKFAGDAS